MKKKVLSFLLIVMMVFVSVLCGCNAKTEPFNPFTEEFIDGIVGFKCHYCNGETASFNDSKDVEILKEVLRTGDYIETSQEIAGYSTIEVVRKNESYYVDIMTDTIIIFKGTQYEVKGSIFNKLNPYLLPDIYGVQE